MTSKFKYERCRNFQVTNWSCNTHEVYTEYQKFIKFCVWGEERCPTTGREHHQVFLCLKGATVNSEKCLRRIADWFGDAHVEACKGSIKQNIEYVTKEKKFHQRGQQPEQGARNDIKQVVEEIKSGLVTVDEILLDNPALYRTYGRVLREIEGTVKRKQNNNGVVRKGIWYYGESNSGKSWRAFNKPYPYTNETHYQKNKKEDYWDGYTGQDTVVINELRANDSAIGFTDLLQMVDNHPFTLKIKYQANYPFVSNRIVITSIKHPCEIYKNSGEDLYQLKRRFWFVKCIDQETEEITNTPESPFSQHLYEPEEMEAFLQEHPEVEIDTKRAHDAADEVHKKKYCH